MHCHCVTSTPQQLLLLLLIWTAGLWCRSEATSSARSESPAQATAAICPYRTINHITHSLPQRCLPTNHPALSSTTTVGTDNNVDTNTLPQRDPITEADSALADTSLTQKADGGSSATNSASTRKSTPSESASEEDAGSESTLGKDTFLSFEEWKKKNLDKYGQSPDQIGKAKKHENLQPRRQPINVLDSFGDEAEIDLDFSGFASEKPQIAIPNQKDVERSATGDADDGTGIPKTKSRSKDAGKTCKERFNYASFDCAATVLKTNVKSSGSSAVLVENKDSYMLNECSVENKFLVLELCEDILIDTIVLANYEFFSSIFRTFRVSVSDRYPVKSDKWKVVGTYEARNTREVQAFQVDNPMIWAKYVRIEFLTHYGNEFYCPISLVRVHGTTMLEDYRHDEDPSKAEDREDDEEQVTETASEAVKEAVPEAVAEVSGEKAHFQDNAKQDNEISAVEAAHKPTPRPGNETEPLPPNGDHAYESRSSEDWVQSTWNGTFDVLYLGMQQCLVDGTESDEAPTSSGAVETLETRLIQSTVTKGDATESLQSAITSSATHDLHSSKTVEGGSPEKSSTTKHSVQPPKSSPSAKSTSVAGADNRPPASSTQPPPANPTIQESFFKSVQKRLQMLESNSTLSLQYIEDQSRLLRDAFNKAEQHQFARATKFIDYLNGTVLNELRDFRQQYDQLWQSTVLELETQREQSQREVIAMNSRLSLLADELVFQKRMAVLQSILVLFCIGLVLFSRGAVHGYLEHPLVQNMLSRSATFKMRSSFMDTPTLSPESTRPSSSYKAQAKAAYKNILKTHQPTLSEDSHDGTENPAIGYSPPTPASSSGPSDVGDRDNEHARHESPLWSLNDVQRSRSSPPIIHNPVDDLDTPTGTHKKAGEYASSPSSTGSTQSLNGGSSGSISGEQHITPLQSHLQPPNS